MRDCDTCSRHLQITSLGLMPQPCSHAEDSKACKCAIFTAEALCASAAAHCLPITQLTCCDQKHSCNVGLAAATCAMQATLSIDQVASGGLASRSVKPWLPGPSAGLPPLVR